MILPKSNLPTPNAPPYVYIRQSTPGQVEHNRESTARQYALADRACQLGWAKEQVVIIDEDLGLSGSGTDKRSGFARLTSEVALAHVGIVLGTGSLAPGEEQRRLVSLAGAMRRHRYTYRRQRRRLSSRRCSTIACCWDSRAR